MVSARIHTIALLVFAFFTSCEKEPAAPGVPPVTDERKVFIVCEGSLNNGNSQLDLYLPEKDSLFNDIYKAANGSGLGDVLQSMIRVNDNYYLSVNNSDRITIVNAGDFRLKQHIELSKPRYIIPAGPGLLYVSSLFQNKVYLIDTTGNNLGTISFKGNNPEGMLLNQNHVYVCPWDTAVNYIYKVGTHSNSISDSISVAGFAPQEILLDREQKLWILSGNIAQGKPYAFTRIDPANGAILKSYSFTSPAEVVRPAMNPARDSIYFIQINYNGGTENNGIYRMSIHDPELPEAAFIQAQPFQYFWALGIEPETGNIYVGDPRGFVQKGQVTVYDPAGNSLKQFSTGVGPGHFFFD